MAGSNFTEEKREGGQTWAQGKTMDTFIIFQPEPGPASLQGEIVIVTGAGGGIGYEAVYALLWLGANRIIVRMDEASSKQIVEILANEFSLGRKACSCLVQLLGLII